MFVYDFPLSPKARTYLKFEAIFNRIEECTDLNSPSDTNSLIRGLIDFISLLEGSGALKIELGKDLDKLYHKFQIWQNDPEGDQVLIAELIEQIVQAQKVLDDFTRQRAVLQNDPILQLIKPRFLTPAGVNCFDTPLFTFWMSLSHEEKMESVGKWKHELECVRIPITCILNLWRLCSEPQTRVAVNGFMQETFEPCEMIEIRYSKEVRGYPMVSGFQSNINVRFLPYNKGAPVGDITFDLAYVRGAFA